MGGLVLTACAAGFLFGLSLGEKPKPWGIIIISSLLFAGTMALIILMGLATLFNG